MTSRVLWRDIAPSITIDGRTEYPQKEAEKLSSNAKRKGAQIVRQSKAYAIGITNEPGIARNPVAGNKGIKKAIAWSITMNQCKVNDCERPVRSKGLCNAHYRRLQKGIKTNKPLPPLPKREKPPYVPGKCLACGDVLQSQTAVFCSNKCATAYRYRFGSLDLSGRLFHCKECGREVITGEKDKRSVFCCRECEKKFWRMAAKEKRQRHKYNISPWQIKLQEEENKKMMEEAERWNNAK